MKKIFLAASIMSLGTWLILTPVAYADREQFDEYGQPQGYYSQRYQEEQYEELRQRMQRFMQEHVLIAGNLTVSRFDNDPNFSMFYQQAEENGQEISSEVGKLYGPQVENEFQQLWRQHLDLYVQYTDALKANDPRAREMTLSQLNEFSVAMAHVLGRESGLPPQEVYALFLQHVLMTGKVIEAHAAGDHQREAVLTQEGVQHASMMADRLLLMQAFY